MSAYQTDEEQVEAIKAWWKENGTSVIVGAVLGFGIIFGWQGWNKYQVSQGEAASARFTVMENAVAKGDETAAIAAAKQVIGEFPDTVYGTFASMQLAKLSYEKGEKTVARQHLEWAMHNAVDESLAELARLRLARLLIDMNEVDAANGVIDGAGDSSLAGEFAILLGDLALLNGDEGAARAAYQDALSKGVNDSDFLRMKMIEVAEVPAS